MASQFSAGYIFCQECCKNIDLLHNDISYTTFNHIGIHRPLHMVKREVNGQVIITRARSDSRNQNNFFCPVCNENIAIFGPDISFCLRQHAQTHTSQPPFVSAPRSEDLSSNSSNRSKPKSMNNSKPNNRGNMLNKKHNKPEHPNNFQTGSQSKPEKSQTNILDIIFKSMPQAKTHRGLKLQKGFLWQISCGKEIICRICNNCKIEPNRIKVEEHLKSKKHEDNIITNIQTQMPPHLQGTIKFLSIYNSNLSCNVCKWGINLDSFNIAQTIQNITEHSTSQSHLNQNPGAETVGADHILNSLAYLDKTIRENKMYIEAKMQPEFKCTLCNKHIEFDSNQSVLMRNFNSHLNSSSHNKCVLSNALLKLFRQSFSKEMENHNLIIHKNNIFCSTCKCTIETSFEKLVMHVKGINNLAQIKDSVELIARLEKCTFEEPPASIKDTNDDKLNSQNQQTPSKENRFERELHALLKTLPKPFKNITYVVKNQPHKVRCLICKSNIAANTNQLKMHLKGSPHPTSEPGNNPPFHVTDNPLLQENTKSDNTLNLQILLNSLPSKFGVMEYIVESGNGNVTCLVCNCIIPATTQNLQDHLEGSKHLKNVNTSSDAQLKTEGSQIHPPPRAIINEQRNHSQSEVTDTVQTLSLAHLGNHSISSQSLEKPDFITILFSKLPTNYHRDMCKIEKSNKVDGFVQCTLCKNPSINPYYLREHLDDKEHINNLLKEDQSLKGQLGSQNNQNAHSKKRNTKHPDSQQDKTETKKTTCILCNSEDHETNDCIFIINKSVSGKTDNNTNDPSPSSSSQKENQGETKIEQECCDCCGSVEHDLSGCPFLPEALSTLTAVSPTSQQLDQPGVPNSEDTVVGRNMTSNPQTARQFDNGSPSKAKDSKNKDCKMS